MHGNNLCKALHKLVPILQNHKIDNMVDLKVRENEVETDEVCPEHEGKLIDAFCHQHRKLCCCICLAKHHRSCQLVEVIADMSVEKEQNDVKGIVSTFSDLEKCVENMQLKSQGIKDDLNLSKQEICRNTDKAIQEIKKGIDDAHATWIKQFEQNYTNSIENFEVASDELKRFLTTVRETKINLQFMLEKGSLEQLFVTKQNQLDRIVNHISRLKSLDIWNFPDHYIRPDYNIRQQLLNQKKLAGVRLVKAPSGTIATIFRTVQKAFGNDILQRKHKMAQKDWMKVTPKLASKITALPETVCYGLFIHDNIILLPVKKPPSLRLYDISRLVGKCVHNELCQNTPYGLCHSRVNESMNEVYVSFLNFVDLYWIDLEGEAKFTKLRSIQINKPMEAISCGLATIISANTGSTFICSKDFVITRTLSLDTSSATVPFLSSPSKFDRQFERTLSIDTFGATVPFLSSSSKFDRHCTTKNRRIVIAEGNNAAVSQSEAVPLSLYGITFDLHENLLVCTNEPVIRQSSYDGRESRGIKLVDINKPYNVVLHPTGEKMLVLDNERKCYVYQIT